MLPVIVIPAYQPEKALLALTEKFDHYKLIIVDDGSTTVESQAIFQAVSQQPNIILLKHADNQGKGSALKTAFQYFLTHFPDATGVITADADGQHLPEDIQRVSEALVNSPRQLILGTRTFQGKIPWRSRLGNHFTRKVFALFSGRVLQDTQTGLRGIPRVFLKTLLEIPSDGYDFEMDMLLRCTQQEITIQEVPISTVYIENNRTSHFNPLWDSLKVYIIFLRYSALSLLSAGIDFGLFFTCFYFSHNVLLSTVVARIFSGCFNFIYCKKVIFKSNGHALAEAAGYLALALGSMMLSYGLVSLFFHQLKFNIFFSKLFSDSLIFAGNFIVQHYVIFKRKAIAEKNL